MQVHNTHTLYMQSRVGQIGESTFSKTMTTTEYSLMSPPSPLQARETSGNTVINFMAHFCLGNQMRFHRTCISS